MKIFSPKVWIVIFFFVIGVGAVGHGFPLINHFADEIYFSYGPLWALSQKSLLPHFAPYGTLTYYACLLLQIPVALGLLIHSGFNRDLMMMTLFENNFLMYIAPRVLHLGVFMAMVWLGMKVFKLGQKDQPPYAPWLILICFSNLVLLTFMHSGKMWIDSLLFMMAALLTFGKKPGLAMAGAAAALANFPLMAFIWLQTLLGSFLLRKKQKINFTKILLIAALIPASAFLLNYKNILVQLNLAVNSYLFSDGQSSAGFSLLNYIFLYLSTIGAYLFKIILTQPLALIIFVLAVFNRAEITDKTRFWFVIIATAFYLLLIGTMFYSRPWWDHLRYMLPFPIFFVALLSSIRLKKTALNSVIIKSCAVIACYTAIISTVTLALPTTYQQAYFEITRKYSDPEVVIASTVTSIAFPYTGYSASLLKKYLPRRCYFRCEHALKNDPRFDFKGHFIDTENNRIPELEKEILNSGKRLILVNYDAGDNNYTEAERGLGSYFISSAWWPRTLGRKVIIYEKK